MVGEAVGCEANIAATVGVGADTERRGEAMGEDCTSASPRRRITSSDGVLRSTASVESDVPSRTTLRDGPPPPRDAKGTVTRDILTPGGLDTARPDAPNPTPDATLARPCHPRTATLMGRAPRRKRLLRVSQQLPTATSPQCKPPLER
jgi:hypothetical protein